MKILLLAQRPIPLWERAPGQPLARVLGQPLVRERSLLLELRLALAELAPCIQQAGRRARERSSVPPWSPALQVRRAVSPDVRAREPAEPPLPQVAREPVRSIDSQWRSRTGLWWCTDLPWRTDPPSSRQHQPPQPPAQLVPRFPVPLQALL